MPTRPRYPVWLLAADRPVEGGQGHLGLVDTHRLERFGFWRVGFAAMHAEAAHQALRDHANQRGGTDIGLDPDIGEARDTGGRVVRVQRGEDEVAGLRGLHGRPGGLLIADLTNQHHIRILAEDRPQRAGKGQLDLLVDLRLVHTGDLVFDRIFNRDDVRPLRAHRGQRRAQRRGLARPSRPDNQNHAVLVAEEESQLFERHARQTELFERRHTLPVVQHAQHHLLAEDGAQG